MQACLAVAFVVHMRAFMILWLISLPTTLAESMGWTTIAVCFIVAFAILGIDAMAGGPLALAGSLALALCCTLVLALAPAPLPSFVSNAC
jgi:predicted membrane chloride channel (bestrophin family)